MSLFRLNARLASNSPADEDDVLSVKQVLQDHGYYDEPSYGMTPYPDRPLFEGIRRFQNDNGLEIDGVMNPGGETEHAMRGLFGTRDDDAMRLPDGFVLSGRVGNGLENPPDAVLKSKQVLGALKYYPGHLAADPTNIIDRPLTKAIYEFQRDHGLQRGGWMKPGGETEAKIQDEVRKRKADTFHYTVSDGTNRNDSSAELAQAKPPTKKSETPKPASAPEQTAPPIDALKIREQGGRYGDSRPKNKSGIHHGVDFEAAPGTPVRSPANGTVDLVGDPYGHIEGHRHAGKFQSVWIKTEDGRRFGFLYITPKDSEGNPLVKKGSKVRVGDPIGTVKDWGPVDRTVPNHTHFEVREGPGSGEPVNPAPWLKQWGIKD